MTHYTFSSVYHSSWIRCSFSLYFMLIRMHSCFAWTEAKRERAWSSQQRAPKLYLSFEILHKTNRVWMLRLCFLLWCQSARCKCERLGMDAMKRDAEHKTHCMTYFSVRLYKENKIVSYSFLGWPIRCQGPPWTPLWLRHWVIGLAYTNINLFYGLWYK